MELQIIPHDFSICQLRKLPGALPDAPYYFLSKTDEEISLVCPTGSVPADALRQDDGWRAFRIQGVLDFSLIGILAQIAKVLADSKIGIFAMSTYNTDYILTKAENFPNALLSLRAAGYPIAD